MEVVSGLDAGLVMVAIAGQPNVGVGKIAVELLSVTAAVMHVVVSTPWLVVVD